LICVAVVIAACFRKQTKKGEPVSMDILKFFKKGGLREISEIVIEEVLGSGNFGKFNNVLL
jgi:hypothetical protein